MPISKEDIRVTNMTNLMQTMAIPLQSKEIFCIGELNLFLPKNGQNINKLAEKMQRLVENVDELEIKKLSLVDLIKAEVGRGTCSKEPSLTVMHQQACLAILQIISSQKGLDFTHDEKNPGVVSIQLPQGYAPLFELLTYKAIKIRGRIFEIDLQKLSDDLGNLCILEDKFIFIKEALFKNKKVFYKQEKINENESKVTPLCLIPEGMQPPVFHFIMDTSSSMEQQNRLALLKESATKFAKALFTIHPQAHIIIKEFSDTFKEVGNFTQFSALASKVASLNAKNATCLYHTFIEQLLLIKASKNYNNILIFTDGKNTIGNNLELEGQLEKLVSELEQGPLSVRAKNKMYIVSVNAKQQPVVHRIAQIFNSPILETSDPNFITALQSDNLQQFATTRDLFKVVATVSSGFTCNIKEYDCQFEQAGEFVALEPIYCKLNETIQVKVTNSTGQIILEDTKQIQVEQLQQSAAALPLPMAQITQFTIFTAGEKADLDEKKGAELTL